MILTITLTISSLLILNLILLKFSCNKIVKTKNNNKQPVVLSSYLDLNTNEERLAPTGS
jgi:hypothetical protein